MNHEHTMNAEKRLQIFRRLSLAISNPSTELEYSSTFELLIAVILSAQSTDKAVNIATRKLFAVANTPLALWSLDIAGLEPYIKTIGLYHAKAKNVIACCELLINCHKAEVPNTRASLEALPGVGRKTANVILNTAFNQPTIAVDTHLFRLGNRIKLATGKNVYLVEQKYLKTIPKAFMQDAHHLLILHGRYTCTARNPKCSQCCIVDLCEYKSKTRLEDKSPSNIPNKKIILSKIATSKTTASKTTISKTTTVPLVLPIEIVSNLNNPSSKNQLADKIIKVIDAVEKSS